MAKKFGFTLAEVLITLGIIGVVAAMTIPTLMANTNSAKFSSGFKKSLSSLSQAGLMAQAQYDLDYALASGTCTNGAADKPDTALTFCAIFNGTLSGASYIGEMTNLYTKDGNQYAIAKTGATIEAQGLPSTTMSDYIGYTMSDGSVVAFHKSAANCMVEVGSTVESLIGTTDPNHCVGFIDVNGVTPPNKVVNCSQGTSALRQVGQFCAVAKDSTHTTDIYPIVFHDATVEPATNAAAAVMAGRTSVSGS